MKSNNSTPTVKGKAIINPVNGEVTIFIQDPETGVIKSENLTTGEKQIIPTKAEK